MKSFLITFFLQLKVLFMSMAHFHISVWCFQKQHVALTLTQTAAFVSLHIQNLLEDDLVPNDTSDWKSFNKSQNCQQRAGLKLPRSLRERSGLAMFSLESSGNPDLADQMLEVNCQGESSQEDSPRGDVRNFKALLSLIKYLLSELS